MAYGPEPQEHSVVYTTLHFEKPWSYENYLKVGGYQALRRVLTEPMTREEWTEMTLESRRYHDRLIWESYQRNQRRRDK